MKGSLSALPAFLFLATIAAAQETAFDAPEPLGTGYLVGVALAFGTALAACYFCTMRRDENENRDR